MAMDVPEAPHLHGLKAVAEALQEEDFPITKEELNYAVGDVDIRISKDPAVNEVPVRRLLDYVPQDSFETWEEVIAALQNARHNFNAAA